MIFQGNPKLLERFARIWGKGGGNNEDYGGTIREVPHGNACSAGESNALGVHLLKSQSVMGINFSQREIRRHIMHVPLFIRMLGDSGNCELHAQDAHGKWKSQAQCR